MRRILAVISALILALLGGFLILNYVRGADERALAGVETQSVLVASAPISAGTTSEAAAASVEEKELPAIAVAPGALTDLSQIAGQVAVIDIQLGEQILPSRFSLPENLEAPARADVPAGMQEVAVLLEPQRVIGGQLTPGDLVGVFVSLDSPPADDWKTKLVLNQVLVTRIEGSSEADAGQSQPPGGADDQGATVPTSPIMVTVALSSPDAERLVFGMEHGTVWLSLQNGETDLGGSRVVIPGNVFE